MFGHLAKDCRNKGEKEEIKIKKTSNRFEALTSRVMQCGVKEVKQQKVVVMNHDTRTFLFSFLFYFSFLFLE